MLRINNLINFSSTSFPVYSKGSKITSVCALLSGVSACLLVALLIVPICWWLFAIATASSHSSILNESHVVSITNQQNSSHNESLIIDHMSTVSSKSFQFKTANINQNTFHNLTTVSVQTTVSSTHLHGTNELTTRFELWGIYTRYNNYIININRLNFIIFANKFNYE